MSDEIEQTDQTPDGTEVPLEPEVSEPQAEEPAPQPESSVDEAAFKPEDDELDEIALGPKDDELDEMVESLAEEPEPEPETPAEPVTEPEPEPETPAEPVTEPEPAVASDLADAVVSPELVPEKLRSPVPWWPFWTLTFAWIALCGGAAYFLTRDPSMPSLRQEAYTFVVAAGLVLTVLGPLLAIVVWAFSRGGVPDERRPGMFVTALLRAAVITFLGVLAWTGTLIVVDALRLGLIRF